MFTLVRRNTTIINTAPTRRFCRLGNSSNTCFYGAKLQLFALAMAQDGEVWGGWGDMVMSG